MTSTSSRLLELPDELLEAIVYHLPPSATVAFGRSCRRCNKITFEPLVWRRHCLEGWRYWHARHEIEEKIETPPAQVRWRQLYNERRQTDLETSALFEQLLQRQQFRLQRMEEVAKLGDDVKELLLKIGAETPDDAEDVLARRFYANAIIGRLNRTLALDKWIRLQNQQMVGLEEVLGAFDLFASSDKGDLHSLSAELQRLANGILEDTPGFEDLSIRRRAIRVAEYLRGKQLLGNPLMEDYHALRNNYMSFALFNEPHTSLPLQTAAIYCCVARKLGINAKPSNFPQHVHVVIEAPSNVTLDGRPRAPSTDSEPERMHMDPWHSSEEVPVTQLQQRLVQLGAPPRMISEHLGSASMIEIVQRTSRNIMNSVQLVRHNDHTPATNTAQGPELEAAWYSMLWAFMILGESDGGSSFLRRRHCLPYLVPHYEQHFPEDLGLVENILAPMFVGHPEHEVLLRHISNARTADTTLSAPSPRSNDVTKSVKFKVGQFFVHKRYNYEGIIIGWDAQCNAEASWIQQMQVDNLPRGRTQPFYNVVSNDKSVRYVAEENITLDANRTPSPSLMKMAGRWFKRWDGERGVFVSNLKDEYPDD